MTHGNVSFFNYQLNVSGLVSVLHAFHVWISYICLYILSVKCESTLEETALTAQCVDPALQPVDQVNPLQQERHDWMWLSRCG